MHEFYKTRSMVDFKIDGEEVEINYGRIYTDKEVDEETLVISSFDNLLEIANRQKFDGIHRVYGFFSGNPKDSVIIENRKYWNRPHIKISRKKFEPFSITTTYKRFSPILSDLAKCDSDMVIEYLKERGITTCPMVKCD